MKVYFASDVHLGAAIIKDNRLHEQLFVSWLDEVRKDADRVYLLGDIFDYWFEYKTVAPRGFVRCLGKLCELTDSGIEVHFFTGNHDVWIFDYLPAECGIIVHRHDEKIVIDNTTLYVGHGDEVGKYDRRYMMLKGFFNSRVAQFCYSLLHPDLAGWIATTWSRQSRKAHQTKRSHQKFKSFMGVEREYQLKMSKDILASGEKIDYFVFGHRHIVLDHELNTQSRLLIIGDWLWNYSYAVYHDGQIEIKRYQKALDHKAELL